MLFADRLLLARIGVYLGDFALCDLGRGACACMLFEVRAPFPYSFALRRAAYLLARVVFYARDFVLLARLLGLLPLLAQANG